MVQIQSILKASSRHLPFPLGDPDLLFCKEGVAPVSREQPRQCIIELIVTVKPFRLLWHGYTQSTLNA